MADAAFDISRRAASGTDGTFDVVPADAALRLVPEWRALADSAAGDNVFFHPDFALAAATGLARPVEIAAVRGGDEQLIALAPFTRSRLGRIASAVRLWIGSPMARIACAKLSTEWWRGT